MSQLRSVVLAEIDRDRIQALLDASDPEQTRLLFDEIDAARIVSNDALPKDVVAMGSLIVFTDLDSGAESEVRLVYPHEADATQGRVSILAPIGSALIGLRVGEQIVWPLPGGRERRLEVTAVGEAL